MSNWNKIEEESMPVNTLVLVKQDMTGVCLRSINDDGDLYDENEVYDDSELEITEWCYIPD